MNPYPYSSNKGFNSWYFGLLENTIPILTPGKNSLSYDKWSANYFNKL
jgi:hypothetical protein